MMYYRVFTLYFLRNIVFFKWFITLSSSRTRCLKTILHSEFSIPNNFDAKRVLGVLLGLVFLRFFGKIAGFMQIVPWILSVVGGRG